MKIKVHIWLEAGSNGHVSRLELGKRLAYIGRELARMEEKEGVPVQLRDVNCAVRDDNDEIVATLYTEVVDEH